MEPQPIFRSKGYDGAFLARREMACWRMGVHRNWLPRRLEGSLARYVAPPMLGAPLLATQISLCNLIKNDFATPIVHVLVLAPHNASCIFC